MSASVVSIEGLGKAYQLGMRTEKFPTFRDALVGAVTAPFRRFRELGGHGTPRGTFWALRDVSFQVGQGEVVALLGRNGAGKSTLLKILSRIVEPTEGRALLRGRIASLLEVGTGFHPELTGRENIYLNGAILGMRKTEIDRKFDQIVAFAETERFLDTPVKRYSSGMYVRLAFAVAAHLEPEILIVDEVLAVGDTEFQKKCLGRMQEVASSDGRTVLFVSHNLAAVRRLCQRAVHLHEGQVVNIGPTGEVVDGYLRYGQEDTSQTDLRDRQRAPGLTPIIASFACKPVDGFAKVVPGASVVFELECEAPIALRNTTIGINISSDQGVRVLSFSTRWEVGPRTLPAGRQIIRCRTDDLPLAPGRYTVDLGIQSNGKPNDYVEHGVVLNVEYADYFGTGEMPGLTQGRILRRAVWELPDGGED